MTKETDFYSPGEAARALGVSERQVFGMLVSGELEGRQDEWARWRISVSAVRKARRVLAPSSDPPESPVDSTGSPTASDEARDDAATTVRIDHSLLQESPGVPGGEETTREEGGALVRGDEQPDAGGERNGEETTRRLPRGVYQGPLAPGGTADETEELRDRLKQTEEARSRLEEEARRLKRENARLREELEAERDKGVFGRLFGE